MEKITEKYANVLSYISIHGSLDPLTLCCLQLKMVLIKCCDISNEVRPMEVAEPWVDCLLEEYFMQVGIAVKEHLNTSRQHSKFCFICTQKVLVSCDATQG